MEPNTYLWIIAGIGWLIITEVIFINRWAEKIFDEDAPFILIKFTAMLIASLISMIIFLIITVIIELFKYPISFLIGGGIIIFFGINYIIFKKQNR